MKFRRLGRTDIEVSEIAFGCWAIVGGFNWGPQDKRDSLNALRAAFDCGITTFDTAEMYGDGYSEELIAEALCDVRDEIVLAGKASSRHFEPARLKRACEDSLRRLKTDRIDLYQLHWPSAQHPVDETLGVLETLRREGKIRAYGVSNFGPRNLAGIFESPCRVESNQLAYNLLFRAVEFEIQPICRQHEISMLCYSPLMQGLLTDKFRSMDEVPEDRARTRHFASSRPQAKHTEDGAEPETMQAVAAIRRICDEAGIPMNRAALAWLLAQPGVATVIAGGRNARQVRENAAAVELQLPSTTVSALAQATDALKQKLGANADMWMSEPRIA